MLSNMAHIAMIPRKDDGASDRQALKPISLLNEDLKFLVKVLSTRINKRFPLLIHRDQANFIPGRQAGDNVRKVIYLIYILNQCKIPGFLLSVDIYKAFDSLS